MREVILYFDGIDDNGFLTNFYPSEIIVGGKHYPTVEHYYQSMKTIIPDERLAIITASTPGQAKTLGRKCTMRDDWNFIKYWVMLEGVRAKFTQNPKLAEMLLNTKTAILVEGTTWHDKIWGVYNMEGKNWLGRIIMRVRKELRLKIEHGFGRDEDDDQDHAKEMLDLIERGKDWENSNVVEPNSIHIYAVMTSDVPRFEYRSKRSGIGIGYPRE